MNCKEKGSFYTPPAIANWIAKRVFSEGSFGKKAIINILEPSCGNGIFLTALDDYPHIRKRIDAVEFDSSALKLASLHENVQLHHADFLFWQTSKKYDVVIGNPPYIVKKKLSKAQADQCRELHASSGLQNREVANIWTAFVTKSTELLSASGVLAFVLPTELLQVNYAREICEFLLKTFQRIEVISFKNLAFENIEQDTVILFAYKKPQHERGLFFVEMSGADSLDAKSIVFTKQDRLLKDNKWSSYIFDDSEISYINDLAQNCFKISDISSSVAGIVTAANDFFIVSEDEIRDFSLASYVKPIIQKGLFVNGSAELSQKDFDLLSEQGKPCYIIDLNGVSESRFTKGLSRYLALGVEKGIDQRYKCLLRDRWHDVPSIWKSEGFFFKRGHNYPKLLVNNADVHVTDSAYRIKMKEGHSISDLAPSFYNSLTLLCSELYGRYYGGGVLEITPNEFKRLPLPLKKHTKSEYRSFIKDFKSKSNIDEFIVQNDQSVLKSTFSLNNSDIAYIHSLYTKIKNRRLRG